MTEEFARTIDWQPKWSAGAPMPQVFSNGQKTFLTYLVDEADPDWDGAYVTMIDNTSGTQYPFALVEFDGHTFRFGIANDEVFDGLPLWKKGLEGYAAHIIENSTWISEIKRIHNVHPYFNETTWKEKKHFSLLFHDEIFEVIATDFRIERHRMTFEEMGIEVVKRMNQ